MATMLMSDADVLSSINFERGFSKYHYTWPLHPTGIRVLEKNGQISSPMKTGIGYDEPCTIGKIRKESEEFVTPCMFKVDQMEKPVTWCMEIDTESSPDTVWIALKCQSILKQPLPVMIQCAFVQDGYNHTSISFPTQIDIVDQNRTRIQVHLEQNNSEEKDLEKDQLAELLRFREIWLHIWMIVPKSMKHFLPAGPTVAVYGTPEPQQPISMFGFRRDQKLSDMVEMVIRHSFLLEKDDQGLHQCVVPVQPMHAFGIGEDSDDYIPYGDIDLIVNDPLAGKPRVYQCHKIILIGRSEYFKSMFMRNRRNTAKSASVDQSASTDRSDDQSLTELVLDDISSLAMIDTLRYMYTGELPIFSVDDQQLIMDIVHASIKFQLIELKIHCVGQLVFQYKEPVQRVDQFNFALKYELADLKSICWDQLELLAIGENMQELIRPRRYLQKVLTEFPVDLRFELLLQSPARNAAISTGHELGTHTTWEDMLKAASVEKAVALHNGYTTGPRIREDPIVQVKRVKNED